MKDKDKTVSDLAAVPVFAASDVDSLLMVVEQEKNHVGALIAGALALLPDKDGDGDPLNTEAIQLLKLCQQKVWDVSQYQLFARVVEKHTGGKLSVEW